MKPYSVEISITTVVMANNETHAMQVAEETASESLGDVSVTDYDYNFGRAITDVKQLAAIGWDGECLPYGGDGSTSLKDILAAVVEEPERCDKTIDMFAEQPA